MAIGIVAVLLALLLPAVQKIRLAASILREKNKVKQIELALHMWDEQQGGQRKRATIFLDILNYIEHPLTPEQLEQFDTAYHIPIYVNESDPSITKNKGGVSYAYNKQIYFNKKYNQRHKILRDGASNTIDITTQYWACGPIPGANNKTYMYQHELLAPSYSIFGPVPNPFDPNEWFFVLPPTFADTGCVLPGSPEAETLTFQLRPTLEEADVRIPQSPYTHGLLVGIADGSVRMLNPNISPRTFWAAVTPNGGEVLGPEW